MNPKTSCGHKIFIQVHRHHSSNRLGGKYSAVRAPGVRPIFCPSYYGYRRLGPKSSFPLGFCAAFLPGFTHFVTTNYILPKHFGDKGAQRFPPMASTTHLGLLCANGGLRGRLCIFYRGWLCAPHILVDPLGTLTAREGSGKRRPPPCLRLIKIF